VHEGAPTASLCRGLCDVMSQSHRTMKAILAAKNLSSVASLAIIV